MFFTHLNNFLKSYTRRISFITNKHVHIQTIIDCRGTKFKSKNNVDLLTKDDNYTRPAQSTGWFTKHCRGNFVNNNIDVSTDLDISALLFVCIQNKVFSSYTKIDQA